MEPNRGDDPLADPYATFRFRLRWSGRSVAGMSEVSAIKRSTEVVEHPGGAGQKPGGGSDHEAVVLARGVTYDVDFHAWANRVWDAGSARGPGTRREDFRPDLTLELRNEAGQVRAHVHAVQLLGVAVRDRARSRRDRERRGDRIDEAGERGVGTR